ISDFIFQAFGRPGIGMRATSSGEISGTSIPKAARTTSGLPNMGWVKAICKYPARSIGAAKPAVAGPIDWGVGPHYAVRSGVLSAAFSISSTRALTYLLIL